MRTILSSAEFVAITEKVAVCRDPTDDKFLELAVNGGADVIVTGDIDLLVLDPFRRIPIVTPRDFMWHWVRQA
jgi:predicted nucleic acid-binding protein